MVNPKVGPERVAETLIGMGNVEEVRVRDHLLGYHVKVRFMFKEPNNIERYITVEITGSLSYYASIKYL